MRKAMLNRITLSVDQKCNAFVNGASLLNEKLTLLAGTVVDDKGKEKKVNISCKVEGARTVRQALQLLADAEYNIDDKKTLTRVAFPKIGAEELSLRLTPFMIPRRAAVLFAYLANTDMPTGIDDDEAIEHLAACGIEATIAGEANESPAKEPANTNRTTGAKVPVS